MELFTIGAKTDTMEITAFIASIGFLIYVGRRRHVGGISTYGIFIAFHVLYNFVPWILYVLHIQGLSLQSNPDVIFTQLWMASVSSACFGIVYLFWYKKTPLENPPPSSKSMRRHYFMLAVPVFILAFVLAFSYGWREYTTIGTDLEAGAGMAFVVTAYVKFWCIGIYLYYLYRFGLDGWAWSLLGLHVVLMLIDNARLTFLPIMLLTLIMLGSGPQRKRQARVYILAFLGIALSVFVRAVLAPNPSDRVSQAITPIVVEGGMGGYIAMQSIYILKHVPLSSLQYGATYVLDPLAWIVPSGHLRDSLSHLHGYIDANARFLNEKYAPWGGYYYMAEAVLNFGYIGPPLVTAAYALVLVYIERYKNRLRMLYFAFVPTLGILFVKSIFGNVIKLFLIQLILLVIYREMSVLNQISKSASRLRKIHTHPRCNSVSVASSRIVGVVR